MQIITRAVGDGALDVDDPLIERLYLSRPAQMIPTKA